MSRPVSQLAISRFGDLFCVGPASFIQPLSSKRRGGDGVSTCLQHHNHPMLRTLILVGIGGAAGSILRYAVTLLMPRAEASSFPVATMLVNLAGCLIIGLLAGFAARNAWMMHMGWSLLATGLCGGFTTFSTFALDNLQLMERGAFITAIVYAALSVIVGIVLCFTGYYLTSAYK
jgi:CrcB protein